MSQTTKIDNKRNHKEITCDELKALYGHANTH